MNTGKTAMSSQAIQTALDASSEAARAAEEAADTATQRTASFLSPSTTTPEVRDNGMSLQAGDRYFNTEEQAEYIYTNAGWKANDSQQAIADLRDDTDPEKGASEIGWDKSSVGAQMDLAKKLSNYAALRSYTGSATRVELMQDRVAGIFQVVGFVPGAIDNGGTRILGADGRLWARSFHGCLLAQWFVSSTLPTYDSRPELQRLYTAAMEYKAPVRLQSSIVYYIRSGELVIDEAVITYADSGATIIAATPGVLTKKGTFIYDRPLSGLQVRGRFVDISLGTGGAIATPHNYEMVRVQDDRIDGTLGAGTKVNGYNVLHYFGGAGAKGGRHAGEFRLTQKGITEPDNTDRNYCAIAGFSISTTGDGGEPGAAKGTYFGGNLQATIRTGALYARNVTGCEFNVGIEEGGSSQMRSGISVAALEGYTARGYETDSAISVSNVGSAGATWKNGILFGAQNGRPAFGVDSSVLVVAANTALSMGIDFSGVLFTGDVLRAQNLRIRNNALIIEAASSGVSLGSSSVSNTPFQRFRSSGVSSNYDSQIIASGGTSNDGQGDLRVVAQYFVTGHTRPFTDNVYTSGTATYRVATIYLGSSPVVTSDERYKQDIEGIEDCVIDAWRNVGFKRFRFKDSVRTKGKDARWHFGVLAQEVKSAFEKAGLDPFAYGLLCYDEWEEQPAVAEIMGEDGELVRPASPGLPEGDRYSIRYEEALVLESALMRRTTQGLEARLARLEEGMADADVKIKG